ncbi:hypothetical protein FOXG_00890 [Fusarium oxysporum f. sp. lycopersici 4287]|uniref:SNF2 N-terminal domain-containing protein n=2 Tax=Fusarium oxysporum TaxID=5507 RepID=A0A0J9U8E3_FUSO4|nr:hypothetical protein FOXG_00890 [Fusarium oxysporum f. sp. lycopersici 4287]EXK48921.1 hypothetical protein FOMG_01655 [Fusarium oxysporum f. sp. melonis 26406]KNA95224.1 hypothetical protein FOXG_00890 [Fusarium oxysporum f. sp. lycopersici 4287]
MASMDHIDAARARLHSLFNASFEKLDDALSNASTTSPFKGGFLCNAMGLGESTQALVAAIQVKRTMPTRSGFIAIVTRTGCVLQWADEIKRHLKPEHHTPYSFLDDDPGIDKNCRLQYNIVVSSCNFRMAKYQDLVNFAVFCHATASYGVDETRKMCRTKLE